jgi:hypothetical protein
MQLYLSNKHKQAFSFCKIIFLLTFGTKYSFRNYVYTGRLKSHCSLIKGVGSDVHERLLRPEPF